MAHTLFKEAVFGPNKTGLSTVGYTLYNANGSVFQIRTTVGVVERRDPGTYGAAISFPDNFTGELVWDTGEAHSVYASEDVNPSSGTRTIFKEAVFGSSRTGLSTVGYRLYDSANTPSGIRSATGVIERAASGTYGTLVTFPASFQGSIVWDTGQITPIFASEEYNPGPLIPNDPNKCVVFGFLRLPDGSIGANTKIIFRTVATGSIFVGGFLIENVLEVITHSDNTGFFSVPLYQSALISPVTNGDSKQWRMICTACKLDFTFNVPSADSVDWKNLLLP